MSNKLTTYLDRHRRAVQLKQLGILKAIDAICLRHGIDYWLDGGTILGAVRHGGFIPWDDDIDIAMRLDDLPRFVEAARRELPEGLYTNTRHRPQCAHAHLQSARHGLLPCRSGRRF